MPTIEISENSFKVLSRWASVSRTINAAINLLYLAEGLRDDDVIFTADELSDLKQALDDCNHACKMKLCTTKIEEKNND